MILFGSGSAVDDSFEFLHRSELIVRALDKDPWHGAAIEVALSL